MRQRKRHAGFKPLEFHKTRVLLPYWMEIYLTFPYRFLLFDFFSRLFKVFRSFSKFFQRFLEVSWDFFSLSSFTLLTHLKPGKGRRAVWDLATVEVLELPHEMKLLAVRVRIWVTWRWQTKIEGRSKTGFGNATYIKRQVEMTPGLWAEINKAIENQAALGFFQISRGQRLG